MRQMENLNNRISLCGEILLPPEYSHSGRYDKFYSFPLAVKRLSGATDVLNVVIKSPVMAEELIRGDRVAVQGEVHSYNNKSGIGNRLVITVFARSITDGEYEPDANEVSLRGTLCKTPIYRTTPMGREICDMMLAVNRPYGRSDYLPCIAWGRLAKAASNWDVGKEIAITGRLQSRRYIKAEGEESIMKTAYEISAVEIEEI